jgi:hypothetical protein
LGSTQGRTGPSEIDTRADVDSGHRRSSTTVANRQQIIRRPGGIGPELTAPPGADEQTRFLAFLGRAAMIRGQVLRF